MENAHKPFAWGLIGTGSSARDFAGDLTYVMERTCFIKAVLGPEEELQDFAKDLKIPLTYTDLPTMLESAQLDAVFITAPAPFRYPYAIRCLQAGIPVLCEAPMALNATQAALLAEVSHSKGVFLMEGIPLRFLPSWYAMQSILRTNSLGEVVSVKANLSGRAFPRDDDYAFPGGGALLDLGVYPLFLCLLLLGEPNSVKAVGRLGIDGQDERCSFLLSFPGGRYANVECSWVVDSRDEAVITGEKGFVILHDDWHRRPLVLSISIRGKAAIRRECKWEGTGWQFPVSEMLNCLEDNQAQSELMPHSLSMRVAALMEEIRAQLSSSGDPIESTAASH